MSAAPGYWMYETSGALKPAIEAYLRLAMVPDAPPMTDGQIAAMRGYLRQWIMADTWRGPMIDVLRSQVFELTSADEIQRWLDRAIDVGIDPL